ncbi:MAG: YgaP family membrane protein [Chitinophagales bacterium]
MEYNMNFIDISIRYALMMCFVILGGAFQSFTLMSFGFVFFLVGITGWSPLFYFLGINHCKNEEQH